LFNCSPNPTQPPLVPTELVKKATLGQFWGLGEKEEKAKEILYDYIN